MLNCFRFELILFDVDCLLGFDLGVGAYLCLLVVVDCGLVSCLFWGWWVFRFGLFVLLFDFSRYLCLIVVIEFIFIFLF